MIVSMMVAGEVAAVDARAPAGAHAAVLLAVRIPGGQTLPGRLCPSGRSRR